MPPVTWPRLFTVMLRYVPAATPVLPLTSSKASAVVPIVIGASVASCHSESPFAAPVSTGTSMPGVTSSAASASAARAQAPAAAT